jgi:TRAP-type C4-dicarboxylate transport system permease large subunit
VLIIGIVFGGIYGGVFTATEAGAIGALCGLILTIARRQLSWQRLWFALAETGRTTATICFLLFAGNVYGRMIALTGIPNALEANLAFLGLTLFGLLTVYILLVVVMGTLLDAGSIMLITVPLMIPLLQPHGVDLFWFGIVTVIAVEIGLLTPPVGLSCFVIHSNLDDQRISLNDIFVGVAPFAAIMVLILGLLFLFPGLATVLL